MNRPYLENGNKISGHGYSLNGRDWHWSAFEPYNSTVAFKGDSFGESVTYKTFSTMERPKLIFGNASEPTQPTHITNGVSPVWDANKTDPCAACGGVCVNCKVYTRERNPDAPHDLDWTYTLVRPLATNP